MTINPETKELKRKRGVYFKALLKALEEHGVSKYRLCQETKIRWNTLWTWTTGQAKPTERLLKRVEKFYRKVVNHATDVNGKTSRSKRGA